MRDLKPHSHICYLCERSWRNHSFLGVGTRILFREGLSLFAKYLAKLLRAEEPFRAEAII